MRFIDSGRDIRLEQLRQEVRMIRSFTIKNLEAVTIGIAAFENKIREYVEAGGRALPQDEMKSDLNAILPHELSDYLIVRVTDTHQTYEAFRDHAVQACAQLLMRKKRLPVNHVREEDTADDAEPNAEDFAQANSKEELDQMYLAAVNRFQRRRRPGGAGGAGGARKTQPGNSARPATAATGNRASKSTNCGGDHAVSSCTKPMVERNQRPCWVCGKVGHVGRDCPQKKTQALKAIEDQQGNGTVRVVNGVPMPCWNLNDRDKLTDVRGFETVARRTAYPTPTRVNLGMHLANKFKCLESSDECKDPVFGQDARSSVGPPPALSQKARKAERTMQENRATLVENNKSIAELMKPAKSLPELMTIDNGKQCTESCRCSCTNTAQTGLGSNSLSPLTSLSVAKPEKLQPSAEKPRNATQSAKSVTWAALEYTEAMFPSLCIEVNKEIKNIEQIMILEEQDQDDLNAVQEKTRIRVTMDSGVVTHT